MLALNDESSTPPTECMELAVEPRRGWYRPPVEFGRGAHSPLFAKGDWFGCGFGEGSSKLSVDLLGEAEGDGMSAAQAWCWRMVEA